MNRREFAKLLAASCIVRAQAAGGEVQLFFVDGYHGGLRGHMPAGAWRDIVTRLGSTPQWKLCLDIEAASWQALAERDPESFAAVKKHLASQRMEMVGGTFSQPYGWAMTGESNIRQLVRGIEVIRESFPGLQLDSYAMQEPCWASCLPQILVSLGFKAAVLKDPSTAWGGYSVGMNAETVDWIGPDGTAIRSVPRYACEELLDTWRTEAQTGSEAFAKKCQGHGIEHPAGMCFQDLGWAARPNVEGDYIRFVTWREYMETVAAETKRSWRFGIEDIRCALPWGEQTLQKIARQVRSAENKMIAAEKMAAMAAVRSGKQYPVRELQAAWDKTLWAQHHDAWITATTRSGRNAWAFQVAAETWEAEQVCDEVIDRSLDRLVNRAATRNDAIYVFNTLGQDRSDMVEVEVATDIGTKSVRVLDSAGNEIASQFEVTRKYLPAQADPVGGSKDKSELLAGESIGAVRLLFHCHVPATSDAAYKFETSGETRQSRQIGVIAKTSDDGSVEIESDLYRIQIDAKRGGTISSLYAKTLRREFCGGGERAFHEFRGYFIEEKAWRSSTENAAVVELLETGPVRATVSISGSVSSVPFRSLLSVTQGQSRIDFHTQFRFAKDTWIGDPWEIPAGQQRSERRRSEYDDRYKLLALFPVGFTQQSIYKNAAFDVCRSTNADTFFDSWDKIKNNIVVNWVDVCDERAGVGLALLTDHTTSYGHGKEHPLSLVMGWGWDGGFWWGKCPLNCLQEARYAVVPHAGTWQKAALWRESAEWSEPLLYRLGAPLTTRSSSASKPLLRIVSPGVQLSAMNMNGRDLVVRLFNAESDNEEHDVEVGVRCRSIQLEDLNGKAGETLTVMHNAGSSTVRIRIPSFGIRTMRLLDVMPWDHTQA